MTAQTMTDENRRLEALASYGIVGTPSDEKYDDVVQLIAAICDVPIALVSLVEETRQWFKARVGFELEQTPRDVAICSYTIMGEDILEISDTLADPRTRSNPLCAGPQGVRFYAGMPLVDAQGLAIGTICVLDRRPRSLTELQRRTLRVMAAQVMSQLELERALKVTKELRGEVDHRVKNSLQSLAALASIKARMARTAEARDALGAIQRRIQTVAMLHEQLYKADNGTSVDLGAYLSNIARFLEAQTPDRLTIRCEASRVVVVAEQAAALGALVNEFVANSIKHAFPDGRRGAIGIVLTRHPDGACSMRVHDDGIGLPEGEMPQQGLGLQIMEASAAQAGAQYEIERDAGGFAVRCAFTPRVQH